MKIIVPPSAKRDPAFGNKKCMVVGNQTVVFDEEFEVIHVVTNDTDEDVQQFDSSVALDRFLDDHELRVRYHTVRLPFHSGDIDDYLYEMGITIEDRVEEPWDVEFSGSRFALMMMINDHWHDFKDDSIAFEETVAMIEGVTPDYTIR